jgi:hypothetical protein
MSLNLTLFKEIIAVYTENHKKPVNKAYSVGKMQSYWMLKHVVHTVTTELGELNSADV